MSDSRPLVSVVTPVYNGERYLAQCIESVLTQTYKEFEYIIVNNCSTDRTLKVAQRYANSDPRIRICNNEQFLGLIQNWNHSLRQISSTSKYCKVVHADDWIFPECIERMVALAEANPSVGIVGAYVLEGTRVKLDGLPYSSKVVSGRDICRSNLLDKLFIFGSPTATLIRSDFIRKHQPFYNENNIHADREACFEVLRSSDFGFIHQVLTFTRRHYETQTTKNKKLNTQILGWLIIIKKYGPVYLSNNEYRQLLEKVLKKYHRFLCKNFFKLRNREVWEFHKRGLENVGYRINLVKLIESLPAALMESASAKSITAFNALKNRFSS